MRRASGNSWRYQLAAAAFAAFGLAGLAQAQVTFTPPADAIDGGNGTVGVLEVSGLLIPAVPPAGPTGGIPNCCGDQNQARTALTSASGPGIIRRNYTATTFNFLGDGTGAGHFGLDNSSNVPAGQFNDNKAYMFRGNVSVPAGGTYTFNVNSDDGFTLAFNNGTVPFTNLYNSNTGNPGAITSYNGNANGALTFVGGRGTEDTGAQVTFPTAGTYHFDVTYHDGCCGDAIEVSSAPGAKTGFDGATFRPIGSAGRTLTKFAGTMGAFTVATVHGNNANSLGDAITDLSAVLAGQAPAPRGGGTPAVVTANVSTINFVDPQNANDGGHGGGVAYPGDNGAIDDNNFSTGARGNLTIPAGRGGHYSFLVYSDDSSRTRLLDTAGNPLPILGAFNSNAIDTNNDGVADAFTNDGGCCSDIIGRYDLAGGTTYIVETISNEQGGGAGHFLYGEFGDQDSFNSGFQLLGANLDTTADLPAGLQLVAAPEPGTFAVLGIAGAALLARRRRA